MRRGIEMPKLLLTGPPRTGKSTVAVRLVHLLQDAGVKVGGFVTMELCDAGRRVGFVVRDLVGAEGILAHEDLASDVRVGRFGVNVAAFERVALPAVRRAIENESVI